MNSVSSFVRNGDLIAVRAALSGPRGTTRASFLLDTGTATTAIMPHVADLLGYGARDGERRATVRSPVGERDGYLLRVATFSALQITVPRFLVNVVDLDYEDIDGLVGLNFLNEMNFEVRPREQRIRAELLHGRGLLRGQA
jgi:predicted aspartyl protease